jgi:hypothetical protein
METMFFEREYNFHEESKEYRDLNICEKEISSGLPSGRPHRITPLVISEEISVLNSIFRTMH